MYSEGDSSPPSYRTAPHEDSMCSSWFDSVMEASDLVRLRNTGTSDADRVQRTLRYVQDANDELQPCSSTSDPGVQPPTAASLIDGAEQCLLYPSHQKILAAKTGLNSGKQHFTSKGKLREARQLKQACQENCKRCERPKLTAGERAVVFQQFWSLSSHERQWLFVLGSVECAPPKKKSVAVGTKRERLSSRKYYFLLNGKKRRVCKAMFKNTLCICDSWIDSALSHVSESGLAPDMRGKHRCHRAMSHSKP